MRAIRVKKGKEPVLHVHRYIVVASRGKRSGFWYCASLKEVREIRDRQRKGTIVEVFSAVHNFREAWEIK